MGNTLIANECAFNKAYDFAELFVCQGLVLGESLIQMVPVGQFEGNNRPVTNMVVISRRFRVLLLSGILLSRRYCGVVPA